MKHQKYFFFALLALLQSCQIVDTSETGMLEKGIPDDGLIISFREYFSNQKDSAPELFMIIKTQRSYPCVNYSIRHQKLMSHTHIDLYVIGIDNNPFCLTAFGQASMQIPFSDIKGKKVLTIRDENNFDQFEINVTDEKVEIAPINDTFTRTESARYYRRIENSFHLNCRTPITTAHFCREFHELLESELGVSEFEIPDDGNNLYISEFSETLRLRANRFYTYDHDEDFIKAGELLKTFTHEEIGLASSVFLSITNWRNKGYYSWDFQH